MWNQPVECISWNVPSGMMGQFLEMLYLLCMLEPLPALFHALERKLKNDSPRNQVWNVAWNFGWISILTKNFLCAEYLVSSVHSFTGIEDISNITFQIRLKNGSSLSLRPWGLSGSVRLFFAKKGNTSLLGNMIGFSSFLFLTKRNQSLVLSRLVLRLPLKSNMEQQRKRVWPTWLAKRHRNKVGRCDMETMTRKNGPTVCFSFFVSKHFHFTDNILQIKPN